MDAAADTISEIERLRQLESDWDSYGAEPIESSALDRAKDFVLAIHHVSSLKGFVLAPPEVGPAPDAGIALLWLGGAQGEIEARFSPYGDRFVVVRDGKVASQGSIDWSGGATVYVDRRQVSRGRIEFDLGFLKRFIDFLRT